MLAHKENPKRTLSTRDSKAVATEVGIKDKLNTSHEVFGQWPVECLFQCVLLVFFCVFCHKSA